MACCWATSRTPAINAVNNEVLGQGGVESGAVGALFGSVSKLKSPVVQSEMGWDRVGLSLGSVRSVYLGMLHPRVRASVPVYWMPATASTMRRQSMKNVCPGSKV